MFTFMLIYMHNKFFKIILLLTAIILFTKCAQVAPLTGGVRDTLPPKLIEAVPINNAINFNSDVVILRFNEFVQIKDIANQLLVTPKLKTEPEIVADGKKIKIKLKKKELLPNTTYRLYFGKAIADMHETNTLFNFNYVFSTGTVIDTLKLSGIVLEEFNTQPISDMIVGLYDSKATQDSLIYNTTPNYVSRTNENGEFMFENLPHTNFKIIAFTDKNKNYLYDGETEKIAFRDSLLDLKSDTSIKLNAFQEVASKTFIKKTNSPYYGYSNIILNKRSKILVKPFNKDEVKNLYFPLNSMERDTVEVFYKSLNDTLRLITENIISKTIDTVIVTLPKQNSALKKYQTLKTNLNGGKLNLNSTIELTFLSLIDTLKTDLSKLKLKSKDDSIISLKPLKWLWVNSYRLQLITKLKQGISYQLKIDTALFFSYNKLYNDSLVQNFTTENKIDYGKLTLKLLFNKKQNYSVQLLNDKNIVVRENYISLSLAGSNAKTIDFIDVLPGTYKVKIIYDDNDDKKWNTGNYLQKKQPEHILFHSKAIKVVSDWEVEEDILIKE